jgi:hypothetical protein
LGAVLLGGLVGLALTLGGCGGSADKSNQPAAAGPTATSTAKGGGNAGGSKDCPTSAAIGTALDMTFNGEPSMMSSGSARSCSYTGTRNSDKGNAFVLIFFREGTAADMARTKVDDNGTGTVPVDRTGIGDQAYSWEIQSIRTTGENVVARKGTHIVQIGAPATLAQVSALANQLLNAE